MEKIRIRARKCRTARKLVNLTREKITLWVKGIAALSGDIKREKNSVRSSSNQATKKKKKKGLNTKYSGARFSNYDTWRFSI